LALKGGDGEPDLEPHTNEAETGLPVGARLGLEELQSSAVVLAQPSRGVASLKSEVLPDNFPGAGSKRMDEQPRTRFGFKPRALGRHDLSRVGNVHELRDRDRI
jgi:hypothetical protein